MTRTLNAWRPGAKESGVLVGRAGTTDWVTTRDEHTLLVGSTGSGKSRRLARQLMSPRLRSSRP